MPFLCEICGKSFNEKTNLTRHMKYHGHSLARERTDLVTVLTDSDQEDMEVCQPKHSSFHLWDRIYLNVDGDHIELKRSMMVVEFPLIRWKMFETYLEDMDEAVEQIRNNRYCSVIEHMGGNMFLNVDNNDKMDCCVDIRYRWCSPIDYKRYPAPQGLSLTFEQFDKLKDVAKVFRISFPIWTSLLHVTPKRRGSYIL